MTPDFIEREIFVCGPPGYMRPSGSLLERLGYPIRRHHEESFGSAPVVQSAGPLGSPRGATTAQKWTAARWDEVRRSLSLPFQAAEFVFIQSRKLALSSRGETVLDIAERYGVLLSSPCRMGVCGTCRLRKIEDEVHMEDQKFLGRQEVEEGYFLACVAHPQGRVTTDA